MTRKLIALFALLILSCYHVHDVAVARPYASRAEIIHLMELSGTSKIGEQLAPLLAQQFVASLRQKYRIFPERADSVARDIVASYLSDPARTKELMSQLVPIYEQTFTADEIHELIAFYETPLGRKLTASLPSIEAESVRAGRTWVARMLPGLQEAVLSGLRAEKLVPAN